MLDCGSNPLYSFLTLVFHTAVALSYKADSLLPALIRALESMKVPRGHLAILEFFCMCLGRDAPAGIPTISTILR